jgi:hypothetical protein
VSDDDPFEDLDEAVGDREGDPFESLDDSSDDRATTDDSPDHDPSTGSPDSSEADPDPTTQSEDDDHREMGLDVGHRDESGPDDHFSDVGNRDGDPFDSFDDTFEEMDVEQLDPDEVWQDLTSAESRGSVGSARQRTYAEVSKHSYCEQCEYFSPPPDVSCGHEGTEIVEFLDMETVRVVDCPVVTEREELESDDGFAEQ